MYREVLPIFLLMLGLAGFNYLRYQTPEPHEAELEKCAEFEWVANREECRRRVLQLSGTSTITTEEKNP